MKQISFYSELYGRTIDDKEYGFEKTVIAELLFRIQKLRDVNCSCDGCNKTLLKYEASLKVRLKLDEEKQKSLQEGMDNYANAKLQQPGVNLQSPSYKVTDLTSCRNKQMKNVGHG